MTTETTTPNTDRAEEIKAKKRSAAAKKAAATRRRNAAKKASELAAAESTPTVVTPTVPNKAIPAAPMGSAKADEIFNDLAGMLKRMVADSDVVLPALDEGKQKWLEGILSVDIDDQAAVVGKASDIRAAHRIFQGVKARIALMTQVTEVATHEDAASLGVTVLEELGKAMADPNYLVDPRHRESVGKAVRKGRQQLAIIADSEVLRVGVSWANTYLSGGWANTLTEAWKREKIEDYIAMSDEALYISLHRAGERKSLGLSLKSLFTGMVSQLKLPGERKMTQADKDWVAELSPMVEQLQKVIDTAQVVLDIQKERKAKETAQVTE